MAFFSTTFIVNKKTKQVIFVAVAGTTLFLDLIIFAVLYMK